MGHRALHAVARPGGRYDCYRSRRTGLAVAEAERADRSRLPADATPVATGAHTSAVLALLDPRTDEALYVYEDGGVTAYLVRTVDVPTTGGPVSRPHPVPVALVPAETAGATRCLDCALDAAKGVLGDAVDAGLLHRRVAERYLAAFLPRHPDAAGTLWLPREVG